MRVWQKSDEFQVALKCRKRGILNEEITPICRAEAEAVEDDTYRRLPRTFGHEKVTKCNTWCECVLLQLLACVEFLPATGSRGL